jgi:ring-1,2-phenylacetyl-CoA epoxidase subunit PaaC
MVYGQKINKMEALKNLLYRMADDALILGHRNSEWTGLGPMLEEDIAFSSMAQDKIGIANALYSMLHEQLGEKDPDTIAFTRNEKDFYCAHLVELPIGEYDFSLVRHFLYDHAEFLRFELLQNSSYKPLADLSKKVKGELKYHTLHADTWMKRLGTATEESKARMQTALNLAFPLAYSLFEPSEYEEQLKAENIFEGEKVLQEKWLSAIENIISQTELKLPEVKDITTHYGGRKGYHTEHLQPMLDEMTEVFRIDAEAQW